MCGVVGRVVQSSVVQSSVVWCSVAQSSVVWCSVVLCNVVKLLFTFIFDKLFGIYTVEV